MSPEIGIAVVSVMLEHERVLSLDSDDLTPRCRNALQMALRRCVVVG